MVFVLGSGQSPRQGGIALLGRAASIAVLAAMVDYTIAPKGFAQDWELFLSKISMALVSTAMAAGFVAAA